MERDFSQAARLLIRSVTNVAFLIPQAIDRVSAFPTYAPSHRQNDNEKSKSVCRLVCYGNLIGDPSNPIVKPTNGNASDCETPESCRCGATRGYARMYQTLVVTEQSPHGSHGSALPE